MALVKFVPYISAIQYTGSNSAEILGYAADYVQDGQPPSVAFIVSESGGTLVIRQVVRDATVVTLTIATGDWVQVPTDGTDDMEVFHVWNVANGGVIGDFYVQAPA